MHSSRIYRECRYPETARCATCEREFEAFAPDQAYECAAEVHGDTLVGAYGSRLIDMAAWRFKGDKPGHVKDGLICDGCIAKLQGDDTIEYFASTW